MDIDIDFPTSFDGAKYFGLPRAAVVREDKYTPHPCGVYVQNIAVDPVSKLAAIPYDTAEDLGYIKIDMLHLGVYDSFSSRSEIDALLGKEPNWDLLLDDTQQPKLFQLAKHGEVLNLIKPRDIETLADVAALIRPGKSNLIKLYKVNPAATRKALYTKTEDFSFKKSHALAYAHVIVIQLHLIEMGKL